VSHCTATRAITSSAIDRHIAITVHEKVALRGSDVPVRLEERELAVVLAFALNSRMSGPVRAARRREALGLPRVSDREAERRLRDNRARKARRHRSSVRA